MIIELFLAGLIIGFLFYELTGYSAGGIIAPAYFALSVHAPLRIASTLLAAVIVWGAVILLSRAFIIFGRRRLMIAIILGFCVKLLLESIFEASNLTFYDLSIVGYIIPGLIASEMVRQKPLPTAGAIAIVTTLVFLAGLLLR